MENTEIQVIDIVNDLNDKAMSKSQVLEKYGYKDGKLRKLLKTNGYEYNQKQSKWMLSSENIDTSKGMKVTYRLPIELHQAIKLQAIFENNNATEIVVKALEQYIPSTTKEIIKQNKK